jgi:hypothetical protein
MGHGSIAARRWGLVAVAIAAAGCSQPNAFSRKNAQVAALRENVNQLESEKSRLERQVADLSSENRQLEDRLVREEARSTELAERLDDVRRTSRSRGGRDDESSTARRDRDLGWDTPSPRRTTPANTRERRVPVAQIPGEIEPLAEPRGGDDFAPRGRTTPAEDEPVDSDLFPSSVDLGARRDPDRGRWMPMARGGGSSLR